MKPVPMQASNGDFILDEWPTAFDYNGNGTVNYEQKTNPSTNAVYRQTYSYTGANVTAISQWVKQ